MTDGLDQETINRLTAASPMLALSGTGRNEDHVVYGKTFREVDFTGRPSHIYIDCTFSLCAGLIIATDTRPYPEASEFYHCRFADGPLPGHQFIAQTEG